MSKKRISYVNSPAYPQQRPSTSVAPSIADLQILSQDSLADRVISICQKPFSQRQPSELIMLVNCLRNITFFKEQFDQHYEAMLEDVAANARLLYFGQNEYVVRQDTYGDTFYIILKGQCRVLKRVQTHIGTYLDKKGRKRDKYQETVKEIMTLKEGDYFGEYALLEKKPRGANVVCITDCHCLSLDKDTFDRIMATKAKRQFLHLLDTLSHNSILREISKNTVKALFMIMERKVFNFGDVVYKQGQRGSSLYFIIEGLFKMVSTVNYEVNRDEDNSESVSKQAEICLLGVNETMGLEEFINEEPRRWRAICQSQEGIVYKLDRIDYKRIETRYPDIVEAIQNIRNSKKEYYDRWKDQHLVQRQTMKKEETKAQKFDFNEYSKNKKQLKQIIMQDQEMSFISRDQVTINDDQEIMLKYSRFFQLGSKPATPFQVNTIEQIQQGRVRSAGYRPVVSKSVNQDYFARPGTEKQHAETEHSTSVPKKLIVETAPTQFLSTQPAEDARTLTSPKATKLANSNLLKKSKPAKYAKNYNDLIQMKTQQFMQMTPQKIEEMAINQRRQREEYIAKKLYIKDYPPRSMGQLLGHIQSAVKLAVKPNTPKPSTRLVPRKKRPIGKPSSLQLDIFSIEWQEKERIHSQRRPPYPIDVSSIPLKYQVNMLTRPQSRKTTMVSPISTHMREMKQYSQAD